MILLTANLMNVQGHCQFRIESDGQVQITSDPVKAAKILFRLGVEGPSSLIDHVFRWGSVEILTAAHPALTPG